MTEEQKAAYIIAQSAILMARVAGMQAENAGILLTQPGQQPMYNDGDFRVLIDESGCYHNAVISLFNS